MYMMVISAVVALSLPHGDPSPDASLALLCDPDQGPCCPVYRPSRIVVRAEDLYACFCLQAPSEKSMPAPQRCLGL